jgi:hypothetical protein
LFSNISIWIDAVFDGLSENGLRILVSFDLGRPLIKILEKT